MPRVAPQKNAGRGLKQKKEPKPRIFVEVAPQKNAGRGLKRLEAQEVHRQRGRPAEERGARIETDRYLRTALVSEVAPQKNAGRGLKHASDNTEARAAASPRRRTRGAD